MGNYLPDHAPRCSKCHSVGLFVRAESNPVIPSYKLVCSVCGRGTEWSPSQRDVARAWIELNPRPKSRSALRKERVQLVTLKRLKYRREK